VIDGEYPYVHEDGMCIWYGECGESPSDTETGKTVNCLYNDVPKPLTDELGLNILLELCPDLIYVDNITGDYMTCCDTDQIVTLQKQTAFPQSAFARCPACLANFMNLYCQVTCNPHNSKFVNATRTGYIEYYNQTQIYEVDYYLSKRFADGTFYSCNEVIYPSTNSPVIGLMCGPYTAEDCTTQRWLDYMGSADNGVTPFQMNFILAENDTEYGHGIEPFDMPFVPCNIAPYDDTYPCSCQDCTAACGDALERPPEEAPWIIAGLDAVLFIMILIFCSFVIIYLAFLAFYYIIIKSKDSYEIGKQDLLVSPEQITCFDKTAFCLDKYLNKVFRYWGIFVTSHPIKVIAIALIIVIICGLGNIFIVITVDPIDLWVPEDSQCLKEKEYYDTHFQPFWRVSQVIITPTNHNASVYAAWPDGRHENFGPVLQKDFLHQTLVMQDYLNYMKVYYEADDEYFTLEDICYAALAPDNTKCTIQSVLQYYQNDHVLLDKVVPPSGDDEYSADYRDHFLYCVNSPASMQDTTPYAEQCLAEYGGPNYPYTCMGGYDDDNYNNATALLVIFLNDNYIDNDKAVDKVKVWEKAFLDVVSNWNNSNFSLSYFAERSIEDELIRASQADILTVAMSYVFIFCYITIALGEIYQCDRLLIDSKVTLGLGGILLILCSAFAAMGVYGYIGVESTLIIIVVVPFLLLAIGADMMFIFVLDYQRSTRRSGETREENLSRVLGDVAPSMVLSCLSESVAFFLGALTTMPAVRTFALYAGLAVLFNFLLLVSAFVALMSLDLRRQEDGRYDIICCVAPKKKRPAPKHKEDSYVIDFYEDLAQYLMVGTPVYFVVAGGYNYSTIEGQNRICGGAGCFEDSLTQQIYYASKDPEFTTIAMPAMSWIDDYLDWLQPTLTVFRPCCRKYRFNEDEFCRSDDPGLELPDLPIWFPPPIPRPSFLPDIELPVPYIYYEQYLTMVEDTVYQLTIALLAVFFVSFLLLGFDLLSSICIILTITMIIVDMLGCMYLWDIDLNAVSLVNLVLAIGISVEFISHVTRYFAQCTEKTRVKRAEAALAHMGSSILSGVAFTNLAGIIPLAFANSQLFEVFYFRMFLLITILGCAHGIIFQPVLLIYLGPKVNKATLHAKQNIDDFTNTNINMGIDNIALDGINDDVTESKSKKYPDSITVNDGP
uniref:Niemann-Pick C1 protein-like n=1 Tax=Saccoglossus kowalevskii TaxID=10224 RepID=A0ABM0LYJ6_SACKO